MTKKQPRGSDGSERKTVRQVPRKRRVIESKVGVLWWQRGRSLAAAIPLADGDETAHVIDSPVNHVGYWPQFKRRHPHLWTVEYEDVPRGRVLFSKETKMFCVYMDMKLHRPRIKAALRRTFGVSGRKVRFATDPHYTTDSAGLRRILTLA